MAHTVESVVFRLEWCRRQKAKATSKSELIEWKAEEQGLKDALLNRDHTKEYRSASPRVFERYRTGLQDGISLLRIECVERLQRISVTGTNRGQIGLPLLNQARGIARLAGQRRGASRTETVYGGRDH